MPPPKTKTQQDETGKDVVSLIKPPSPPSTKGTAHYGRLSICAALQKKFELFFSISQTTAFIFYIIFNGRTPTLNRSQTINSS